MVIQNGDLDDIISERAAASVAHIRNDDAGHYGISVFIRNDGRSVDGYFVCFVCGLHHFFQEAIRDGECFQNQRGLTSWLCPVCGFDTARAACLETTTNV